MHTRAHDEKQRERRGDTLVLRDLPVFSPTLGVSGKCDVVEFRADLGGVPLQGEAGLWLPYPVEYKRGSPKSHDADRLFSTLLPGDVPRGNAVLQCAGGLPVLWGDTPARCCGIHCRAAR